MKKFHQFQHPPIFQGVLDGEFYFEGWYFKMVSINEEDVLALIPGIALNKKNKSSHAFIQILDGIHAQYHYISYPLEEFRTSKNHFFVKIRKSSFNKKGIHLDINEKNVLLSGDLRFKTQVPLPYHGFSPGVMGIFTYIPFMECNHGVVSMDHVVE